MTTHQKEREEQTVFESLKNQHKKLGKEIEAATSSSTINKKQTDRRIIRDILVETGKMDREEANKLE